MPVHIGTSGWQYRHWRGRFYPRRMRGTDELTYYAQRFATVEANATFYRLPEAETFAAWARSTPDSFVFAMKASRFLTHMKRLKEPEEPVRRMMERARRLGDKLGPVLLQLPPNMRRDTERLRATLAAFGAGVRVAVEFRHDSWSTADVRALLERHDAALCLADRGSRLVTPAWRTASWGYLRFHEGLASPPSCYGERALDARARLVAEIWGADADVYAYFNNDAYACALRDACVFARSVGRAGLRATAVPDLHEISVG